MKRCSSRYGGYKRLSNAFRHCSSIWWGMALSRAHLLMRDNTSDLPYIFGGVSLPNQKIYCKSLVPVLPESVSRDYGNCTCGLSNYTDLAAAIRQAMDLH